MKLFGKKGGDAQAPDNNDLGDETFDSPDTGDTGAGDLDAPEMGGDPLPAKTLTAPSRSLSAAAGGGRKNLLILVALVVLAGGAGGYFYFMSDMPDYSAPVHVTGKSATIPEDSGPPQPVPPAPDVAATTPPAADPLAAPAADPLAAAPAPAADPLATPAADPLAGVPAPAADPLATTPAADPLAAPPPETAGLGAPPEDANAVPLTPGTAPVAAGEDLPLPPDAMLEQPPVTPPAGTAATTPATAPTTTAAAPVEPAKPSETAPSWAAPGTAAVPGTSNPAVKPTLPTDAELAIVQNAAVLDQLSRPVTPGTTATGTPAPTGMPFDPAAPRPGNEDILKKLQQNLEKTAIRRSLPSGYMTIRKESDAGDIDSRLTSARTALAQGRIPAALELFEDLRKDYPKDKRILMGRAVSLQKIGQEDEALAAYETVLNADPKNLDALSNMLGLLKSKDSGLAVSRLQELRDAYPYQADITAQLGIAYAANGQYDQGLKYLEMADSLKPGSAYVLYNKAVMLDKMGRRLEAAVLYRSILRKAADGEIDQPLPLESIRNRLSVMN